jgi:hypothetical protein
MFGPDICGSSTKRIHVIFEKNGQNHLIKKTIPAESDEYTHLYTLIVRPDNTYEVCYSHISITTIAHRIFVLTRPRFLSL